MKKLSDIKVITSEDLDSGTLLAISILNLDQLVYKEVLDYIEKNPGCCAKLIYKEENK